MKGRSIGVMLGVATFAAIGCATPRPGTGAERARSGNSATSPTQAVESLLAADRSFASAAEKVDAVTGIAAMFAEGVLVPAPRGVFLEGKAAAESSMRANADNNGARVSWSPLRGGVSADGMHGFTFGYMTLRKADGSSVPLKYMAYWMRDGGTWRVAAYKRSRRPEGEVSTAMLEPALPARMLPVVTDAQSLERLAAGLRAAEQGFSDEAQRIGLGAAFAKHGSADAVNIGAGPAFTVGAAEIGKLVGGATQSTSSPLKWNADRVLVASSGDLGVTFGVIRSNTDAAAPGASFFTIWRRASAGDPWRYVAE